MGLLKVDGVAATVLNENGISAEHILELVNQLISNNGTSGLAEYDTMTPRAKRIIDQAYKESVRFGSQLIGTEHILIALLKEPDSIAVRLLSTLSFLTATAKSSGSTPAISTAAKRISIRKF